MRPTLSGDVLQHVRDIPQLIPQHDLRFPEVLNDLMTLLCALPETAHVQFQQEQGSSRLDMFGNASGQLEFALYGAVYRLRWLLEDVISGLNERRPLRAVTAGRGVMELAATTRRLMTDLTTSSRAMSAAFQGMNDSNPQDPDAEAVFSAHQRAYQLALGEMIRVLGVHVHASRIDWNVIRAKDQEAFETQLEGVDPELKQKNVLTLLGSYSGDKTVNRTLKAYYALQCDYTHPNRGAHHLVTSQVHLADNLITYQLGINPDKFFSCHGMAQFYGRS